MTITARLKDRAPDAGGLLADPLFRKGYGQVFDGVEIEDDIRWSEGERLAYRRGRDFGHVVMQSEGQHLPLTRGGVASPTAAALLARAMARGEVK